MALSRNDLESNAIDYQKFEDEIVEYDLNNEELFVKNLNIFSD